LKNHLPALFGQAPADTVSRVKCDYRQTIAELHLEDFIEPWVKFSNIHGMLTRNQAHGAPGNLLDLYAAADIPETEIFGPSGLNIPGLRMDDNFSFHSHLNNPLGLKFSSSASHVTGKKYVSSESCTWLGEHFRVSLSQVKPEIDQLFVSGINHVFYHGMCYSPFDETWPGWLFYASVNFGPTNSFWRDLPALNEYIARCQAVLQAGQPDNDILIYWPVYDIWQKKDGMLQGLTVHNLGSWLMENGFYETAKHLWEKGYSFDYISDRQLLKAKVRAGKVRTGSSCFEAVVVPECEFMPAKTLNKIMSLAKRGATIIVVGNGPNDVPGYSELAGRRELFNINARLLPKKSSGINSKVIGNGRVLIGDNIRELLKYAGIRREPVVDTQGVEFIRRKYRGGHYYFISNLGANCLNGWVPLSVKAKSVVIYDALREKKALAALRENNAGSQIFLQLRPGESLILRTFKTRKLHAKRGKYIQTSGEPIEITGKWKVKFIAGGPELPEPFETKELTSWTKLGGTKAKRFAGTAVYKINFEKPEVKADEWMLDLGEVFASARVRINGKEIGTLFTIPFEVRIRSCLLKGASVKHNADKNVLEVEVTNLSANRIRDMDRRQVKWKKFYEINFVNINYRKFDASDWELMDSGLLGPVRLIPYRYKQP